jgi:Rrf2 family protein
MDVIRRNTDYGLRAMVNLASRPPREAVSAKVLAAEEEVSYQLICKLLQKLQRAGFIKSMMGPSGGYRMAKPPSEITLGEVVDLLQGPVVINRCVVDDDACSRQHTCVVSASLRKIQRDLENYMTTVTLEQLVKENQAQAEKG